MCVLQGLFLQAAISILSRYIVRCQLFFQLSIERAFIREMKIRLSNWKSWMSSDFVLVYRAHSCCRDKCVYVQLEPQYQSDFIVKNIFWRQVLKKKIYVAGQRDTFHNTLPGLQRLFDSLASFLADMAWLWLPPSSQSEYQIVCCWRCTMLAGSVANCCLVMKHMESWPSASRTIANLSSK